MNELGIITKDNGDIAVQCSIFYKGMNLADTNYKKWTNGNILNNQFAIEGIDYIILNIAQGEVKTTKRHIDFTFSLDFAKKLSMQVKNEKGEFARNYFLQCEKKLKAKETELQATLYNELLGYRRLAEIRQIKIDLNKEVRNLKKAIPQPNDAPPLPKYFQTRLNLE